MTERSRRGGGEAPAESARSTGDRSFARSFRTTPTTILQQELEPEAYLSVIPRDKKLLGMFVIPKVRDLGADFDAIVPRLLDPPRLGHYLPFSYYPLVDSARLAVAAARKLHPDVPFPEACRRVGRHDVEILRSSTLGGAVFSLCRDPESILSKLPQVCPVIIHGAQCRARRDYGRRMRVEFIDVWTSLEHFMIGTLEGIVLHFGLTPVIDVRLLSPSHAVYDLRWY